MCLSVAVALVLGACGNGGIAETLQTNSPSTSEPTVAAETERYTNAAEGFAVSYPSEWTEQADPTFIVLFAPPLGSGDVFLENVGVLTDALPAGTTLADYVRSASLAVSGMPESEILSSEASEVAGYPAYETRYEFEDPDAGSIAGSQWIFNVDSRVYLFTYTAQPGGSFDEWLPAAESIVESFEVI